MHTLPDNTKLGLFKPNSCIDEESNLICESELNLKFTMTLVQQVNYILAYILTPESVLKCVSLWFSSDTNYYSMFRSATNRLQRRDKCFQTSVPNEGQMILNTLRSRMSHIFATSVLKFKMSCSSTSRSRVTGYFETRARNDPKIKFEPPT